MSETRVAQFTNRSPIPTLWSGGGAEKAWKASRDLFKKLQPDVVLVHHWPVQATPKVCGEIRRDLGSAIGIGVGIDSIAREVAQGKQRVSAGASELVDLAVKAVEDCGASVFELNAEASWKRPPTSIEAKRLNDLILSALREIAARYPNLPLGHTAYDHPTFHSQYPWKAWLGPESPIGYSAPQVYAAPEGEVMAKINGLDRREAAALSSWQSAIRAGWIRPDAPEGTPGDLSDVDWIPYYQLHHVPAQDTIEGYLRHPVSKYWAIPTRFDEEGEKAIRCIFTLWQAGVTTLDDLATFQAANGLKPDKVPGPKTQEAILARAA